MSNFNNPWGGNTWDKGGEEWGRNALHDNILEVKNSNGQKNKKITGNVFFTIDGYLLGRDKENTSKIYVLETFYHTICDNENLKCVNQEFLKDLRDKEKSGFHAGSTDPFITKLKIKLDDFLFLSGVTKDEDAHDIAASNAIASTFLNNMNFKNGNGNSVTLKETIKKISTVKNKVSLSLSSINTKDRIALTGTIRALLGYDSSNGATHWDGFDFAGKGVKHTKVINQGMIIYDSHIKPFVTIWKEKGLLKAFSGGVYTEVSKSLDFIGEKKIVATGYNKGRVLYKTTAQYGKSIFYGPNLNAKENESYNWRYY